VLQTGRDMHSCKFPACQVGYFRILSILMNKIFVLLGLIFALGILGAGTYVFLNQKAQTSDSRAQVTTQQGAEQNVMGETATNSRTSTQSLKDLLSYASNQKCTFTDPDSGSSGEVFGSTQSVRVDFSAGIDKANLSSHMISDGANMYLWFDGETKGFKASLADIEKFSKQGYGIANKTVDINSKVAYECDPWAVDPGMLTIPLNIEFTDFSTMLQGVGQPSGSAVDESVLEETKAAQCSACETLPDEAETQCKQAIGC